MPNARPTLPRDFTVQDLLTLMPLLRGQGWYPTLFGFRNIRNRKGICPGCALADHIAGRGLGYSNAPWAALHHALNRDTPWLSQTENAAVDALAAAADQPDAPHRRALMEALGMEVE